MAREWTALGKSDPLWAILTAPEKKDGGWDTADFFTTGIHEVNHVIEVVKQLTPINFDTAVDFGCGVGRLCQALARHFQHVIGVDIAKPMVERAKELSERLPDEYKGRCEFRLNVAPDLSLLPDACADFVYSSITLQHIDPALGRGYIAEFFRVVRPGGQVVFQMPTDPGSNSRRFVQRMVPVALTNYLWKRMTGSAGAMEGYCIPEAEVSALVAASGGTVLQATKNHDGPLGWDGRKYWCIRRA